MGLPTQQTPITKDLRKIRAQSVQYPSVSKRSADRDQNSPKPISGPKPIRLGITSGPRPPWDTLFLSDRPITGHPSTPSTPFKSIGSYPRRQSRLETHNVGAHGVDPTQRASNAI